MSQTLKNVQQKPALLIYGSLEEDGAAFPEEKKFVACVAVANYEYEKYLIQIMQLLN